MLDTNSVEFKKIFSDTKTPAFVFSKEQLRHNLENFRKLFPGFKLFYSVKTNPLKEFLEVMREEGVGFDTATLGEIELVSSLGVSPSRFIFTHPIKLPVTIEKAYIQGVENFICDSLDELKLLADHAPKKNYFIRLLPPSEGTFYEYTDKFGAAHEEVDRIMQYAKEHGIPVRGVTFHVGSQSMQVQPWIDTLRYVKELMNTYHAEFPDFRVVNIGSGFPFNYGFDSCITLKEIAETVQEAIKDYPEGIEFWAEPGRILVADTGVLLVSVIKNIQRSKNHWLYVDFGVYHGLIEILESRGKLRYRITSSREGQNVPYNVSGNTLDPDDTLAIGALLPEDIQMNDRLLVHDIGAYTVSLFSSYHALPRPTIHILDK